MYKTPIIPWRLCTRESHWYPFRHTPITCYVALECYYRVTTQYVLTYADTYHFEAAGVRSDNCIDETVNT